MGMGVVVGLLVGVGVCNMHMYIYTYVRTYIFTCRDLLAHFLQ